MTELLYLKDSYVKEFKAKVVKIAENKVILDKTAFYPGGGGLPYDIGVIIHRDKEYRVIKVGKEENKVVHFLEKEPDFSEGDMVKGVLDWERRYTIMRMHTAAHILAAVMYKEYNALISGGAIGVEESRLDFTVEKFSRLLAEEVVLKANEIAKKGIEVKIYFLPREQALQIPGVVKLLSRMPPQVKELRIVEIPNVDIQADGGPHVANTSEIGEIILLKYESKGRLRKRIYYTVKNKINNIQQY